MKEEISKKIGFIGAGNIAEAIISGIVKSGVMSKHVFISDVNKKRLNYICKKYKVIKCYSNSDVIKCSDVIFLAVKPYQIEEVLKETACVFNSNKSHLTARGEGKLVISVAAGIKTSKIEKHLKKIAVVRVMPNTPALVGEGAIAIVGGKYAKKTDIWFAKKLLSTCGIVIEVAEKDMDVVTAVSGSGPAYIFYIAEIIRKTAEKLGLKKDVAKKLVNQTLLGASKMLISSENEPEVLRQKVTSKGGTTEAAFKVLLEKDFGKILKEAISVAAKKSKKLSNG